MIRKHIVFYGSVQGVGFRYSARHAADLYGCTGWARNEWDGSVTMEIQGTKEAIDAHGWRGILEGPFSAASVGLLTAVLCGLVVSVFARSKDK